MAGCLLVTLVGGGIWWVMNRPVDQMIVEKGLDKHLKVDEALSFGELYFLLELSPKDIPVLHVALAAYVQQKIAKGGHKEGYSLISTL